MPARYFCRMEISGYSMYACAQTDLDRPYVSINVNDMILGGSEQEAIMEYTDKGTVNDVQIAYICGGRRPTSGRVHARR